MSYVTSYYHVVIGTYERMQTINYENSDKLYAVMAAKISTLKSKALIINGYSDHVHILLSLHPTIALSDMMRSIKSETSVWMKASGMFPHFMGWGKEYGAFSLSESHRQAVYDYIKNQHTHHTNTTSEEEFRRLVSKAGLRFYED